MRARRLFAISMFVAASTACSTAENGGDDAATTNPAASIEATVLMYQEQEAGTDSYPVRVLVTPAFMRIDDGYAESDFALLDRAARTVFSVSHEDRSILVVAHTPADRAVPAEIDMALAKEIDVDAPPIAGKQPVHVRFLANSSVCHEAVVVPGLLEDAVKGLIEYEEILASGQQENLAATPESIQSPCYLTRYVYAPARHLRQGFPIQEWDDEGYRRFLADYREAEQVAGELFRLPQGYEHFSLGD